MSQLQVKPNIDNGDLSKQLEFDFNKKDIKPISFGNLPLTFIDMLNLVKFTELLESNKKE
jgi:hypothetical protein|tara:strand:+ start:346 stop:525 length:180 start_codon:yes stop_codon:yes gene_type:complete